MTISTTIQLKIAITILEGHPSGGSSGNGSGGCGGGGDGGGSGCDVVYCSGYCRRLNSSVRNKSNK